MKNKKIILTIGVVALVTSCYISKVTTDNKNIKNKAKEQEQALKCYKYLNNDDDIKRGCEKYFKNDKWYINYIKESPKKLQKL